MDVATNQQNGGKCNVYYQKCLQKHYPCQRAKHTDIGCLNHTNELLLALNKNVIKGSPFSACRGCIIILKNQAVLALSSPPCTCNYEENMV